MAEVDTEWCRGLSTDELEASGYIHLQAGAREWTHTTTSRPNSPHITHQRSHSTPNTIHSARKTIVTFAHLIFSAGGYLTVSTAIGPFCNTQALLSPPFRPPSSPNRLYELSLTISNHARWPVNLGASPQPISCVPARPGPPHRVCQTT